MAKSTSEQRKTKHRRYRPSSTVDLHHLTAICLILIIAVLSDWIFFTEPRKSRDIELLRIFKMTSWKWLCTWVQTKYVEPTFYRRSSRAVETVICGNAQPDESADAVWRNPAAKARCSEWQCFKYSFMFVISNIKPIQPLALSRLSAVIVHSFDKSEFSCHLHRSEEDAINSVILRGFRSLCLSYVNQMLSQQRILTTIQLSLELFLVSPLRII